MLCMFDEAHNSSTPAFSYIFVTLPAHQRVAVLYCVHFL